jgi:hypothetical protein
VEGPAASPGLVWESMNVTLDQLVERSDGASFVLTVQAAGNQVAGQDPLQLQFPTSFRDQARTLVQWSFRYRTRNLKSLGLVVPTPLSANAQQLAMNAAWFAMDSIDSQMGTGSVPYNGLTGQPNQPRGVPPDWQTTT